MSIKDKSFHEPPALNTTISNEEPQPKLKLNTVIISYHHVANKNCVTLRDTLFVATTTNFTYQDMTFQKVIQKFVKCSDSHIRIVKRIRDLMVST